MRSIELLLAYDIHHNRHLFYFCILISSEYIWPQELVSAWERSDKMLIQQNGIDP